MNYLYKRNFTYVLLFTVLMSISFAGCNIKRIVKPAKEVTDPGADIIFPWGEADPALLDGKPLRPLPETAPQWAKEKEAIAASYYLERDLEILCSYVGNEELIFILCRPTGGNMEAQSFALWKKKGEGFVESWWLDVDREAREAIWLNHKDIDGIWGDSIISTYKEDTFFETFTYHNYPYPKDPNLGKSHSQIWVDEITIFKREEDKYIPVGSGVTYYKQGYYPSWMNEN